MKFPQSSFMIVAAAIKDKAGVIWLGRRHCRILKESNGQLKGCEQGFVNCKGRFLNREEAIACGQITKLKYHHSDLFSEEILPLNVDKGQYEI